MTEIEADYLVVGAGAAAMAFVDTLLDETDAKVVVVDRHKKAGGHWNDAYPFVRLHQPSAYYGVGSTELGRWEKSVEGLNRGLYELASGNEVLSYFDTVMRERFLGSGRVTWMPSSDYSLRSDGTHQATSLDNGDCISIDVKRKIVDTTLAGTAVPSTHPPAYRIASGIRCIPINDLEASICKDQRFTVVGGGKTGIDACLRLLEAGVDPLKISWIVPQDSWFMDRQNTQPGFENFTRSLSKTADQFQSIIDATSTAHLFELLEQRGLLLRLDPGVNPTSYRCATVSQNELDELRRIKDIVRLGRISSIESDRIVLRDGSLPAEPDTIYVDCSASAVQPTPSCAVFEDNRINLLWLKWCQPVFSAAVIAFVESNFPEDRKNSLCMPMRRPELPIDWLRMWGVTLANMSTWRQEPKIDAWLSRCRLNSTTAGLHGKRDTDVVDEKLVQSVAQKGGQAAAKVPLLLRAQ